MSIILTKISEEIAMYNSKILSQVLNLAIQHNIIDLNDIIYLVENGADPRYGNDDNLVRICKANPNEKIIEIIDYLIHTCQCDVNSRNSKALAKAILYDDDRVVKYLLENGAIITDRVIESVIYNGHHFKLLLQFGADVNVMLDRAMDNFEWLYDTTYIEFVVENNIDLNEIVLNKYQNREKMIK